MKSDVETLSPTRVKLTVAVTFDEFKPSVDRAYKEIASQITVPGFRRGKVPPAIIDQRMGHGAVLEQAINDALPKFYQQAAADQSVQPVSQPDVEVSEIPDLKAKSGDLGFTVEVDVLPEVTLPEDLSSFEVTVDEAKIDEDQVTAEIDALRDRFATLVEVDEPATDNSSVTLTLAAVLNGEEVEEAEGIAYEVGSGNLVDGIDEALIGLSKGESTVFTSELRGGEHAGEAAEIKVLVEAVSKRELPELDDEFAQTASPFDTVEELTTAVRENVEQAGKIDQITQAQELFLEQLREKLDLPVPQSLVDEQAQRLGDDASDEDRATGIDNIKQGLQREFILDELVRKEQAVPTQEELSNYVVMTAQRFGIDPEQYMTLLQQQPGGVGNVVTEVTRRKGLLLALSEVTVKTADGTEIDLGLVEDDETEGGTDDKAADDKAATADDAAEDAPTADAEQTDDAAGDVEGAAPAKKTTKKATAKKTTAKKATKKTADATAKKAAAKKSTTKKAAAKKSTTKKTPAKKTAAKKAADSAE